MPAHIAAVRRLALAIFVRQMFVYIEIAFAAPMSVTEHQYPIMRHSLVARAAHMEVQIILICLLERKGFCSNITFIADVMLARILAHAAHAVLSLHAVMRRIADALAGSGAPQLQRFAIVLHAANSAIARIFLTIRMAAFRSAALCPTLAIRIEYVLVSSIFTIASQTLMVRAIEGIVQVLAFIAAIPHRLAYAICIPHATPFYDSATGALMLPQEQALVYPFMLNFFIALTADMFVQIIRIIHFEHDIL